MWNNRGVLTQDQTASRDSSSGGEVVVGGGGGGGGGVGGGGGGGGRSSVVPGVAGRDEVTPDQAAGVLLRTV